MLLSRPRRRAPSHLSSSVVTLALAVSLTAASAEAGKGKERDRKERDRKGEREREPKGPPSLALESLDLPAARAVVIVGGAGKAPDARLFVFHDDHERHFVALYASCDEASRPTVAEEPAPEPAPEWSAADKISDPSVPSTDSPPPPAPAPLAPPPAPPSSPAPPPPPSPASAPITDASATDPEAVAAPPPASAPDGALRCRLDLPRPYLKAHVVGMTVRLRGKEVAADEHVVVEKWTAAQAAGHLRSTPPAVPMTTVQAACEDPGFEFTPRSSAGKTPNVTDEEEVEQTEDPGAD